jgi:hypothetical protein
MMFRVDDIVAAALLSIVMFRRIEIVGLREADYPAVRAADFHAWRQLTLRAYWLGAGACLFKIVASQLWLAAFGKQQLPLSIGGFAIFSIWLVCVVVAWRQSTQARVLRGTLGIGPRPS